MGCVGDLKLDIRQSFVDMSRDRGALIEGQTRLSRVEIELIREGNIEGCSGRIGPIK